VPDLKIKVITHGVDFMFFNSPATNDISLKKPYILSVGALRWRKGYRLSIEAFANVSREFSDWHYYIVGKEYDVRMRIKIDNYIKEHGLQSRVHILDNVDDFPTLKYIYQNAELFFLMSQHRGHDVEAFGLVFLEAAASGLPVVGTTNSGIKDAINVGANGYLVDAENSVEAAAVLKRIMSNSVLRQKMKNESLVWAKSNDWSRKMPEYLKIYESI